MKKQKVHSSVSIARLKRLRALHLQPIKLVVYKRTYVSYDTRNLILGSASRLDAFSGYLVQT